MNGLNHKYALAQLLAGNHVAYMCCNYAHAREAMDRLWWELSPRDNLRCEVSQRRISHMASGGWIRFFPVSDGADRLRGLEFEVVYLDGAETVAPAEFRAVAAYLNRKNPLPTK